MDGRCGVIYSFGEEITKDALSNYAYTLPVVQLYTFITVHVSPFIGYTVYLKSSLLDNGPILSISSHKNKWIGQFVAIIILLYYYYDGYHIWSCSIDWCLSEQGCTIKWSNRWIADVYRKGGGVTICGYSIVSKLCTQLF